jgi:hypothetical protein
LVVEDLWAFGGIMLSCFFIFVLFLSCDLHICLDGCLFQFYSIDFSWAVFPWWLNFSTTQRRKNNWHNNNNHHLDLGPELCVLPGSNLTQQGGSWWLKLCYGRMRGLVSFSVYSDTQAVGPTPCHWWQSHQPLCLLQPEISIV